MVGPRDAAEMDEGGNGGDRTHQGGFSDLTLRKGRCETSTAPLPLTVMPRAYIEMRAIAAELAKGNVAPAALTFGEARPHSATIAPPSAGGREKSRNGSGPILQAIESSQKEAMSSMNLKFR